MFDNVPGPACLANFSPDEKKPVGFHSAGFEKAAENIDIQEFRNGQL
jgi:hypothetical protein